jgi:hypothetical protein
MECFNYVLCLSLSSIDARQWIKEISLNEK